MKEKLICLSASCPKESGCYLHYSNHDVNILNKFSYVCCTWIYDGYGFYCEKYKDVNKLYFKLKTKLQE